MVSNTNKIILPVNVLETKQYKNLYVSILTSKSALYTVLLKSHWKWLVFKIKIKYKLSYFQLSTSKYTEL